LDAKILTLRHPNSCVTRSDQFAPRPYQKTNPDERPMETLHTCIYDYPKYYDLIFGSDCKAELDFLSDCFLMYADGDVQDIFEPACGTGRLIHRFALRGFNVAGLDLNPKAVRYCNDRFRRTGFEPSAFVGDMTDFKLQKKADAAFNTINSFRHLNTETLAFNHLHCMASAVRSGGLYVLGLHLTPTEGESCEDEYWTARRGHLQVNTRMWMIENDLEERYEEFGMSYDVYTPTHQFRIEDRIRFRTYTAPQMERLLAKLPQWEIAETYDFAYEVECPIDIDSRTEDVVFILKRK
jgi:SAM-dependent methyltransferase